ncbi:nucleotide exchange factor GrpE [Halobacteriovorax sp. GB3]|uniref:nucleotide exchange factor GrpE n=1 Tax=Halobacteriovorax sp. GB3 TaxID=2719615 RepID=UPI00235EBFE9|nr:nucleotide exchange factor GrpE [Halobacteriovorax sp. GB3]MDD0854464.1 nucleotide exchange factor GrpE [Halobacteriovorax sp. GB3]
MSETQNDVQPEETKVEAGAESTEEVEQEAGEEVKAEDNVEELKSAEEDYKAKFFYVAAEMENMRKRFEREKSQLLKFGNEKVLSSLIEVVDNLERTMQAIENDEDEKVKNIYVGVDMVKKQFVDVLIDNGLEQIEALGKKFDPNFHEALAQQPAEGKEDEEVIVEYQKGYKLNGRVLRASKVVVVKN